MCRLPKLKSTACKNKNYLYFTCITIDGPPAAISGGSDVSGHASMFIMVRDWHRTNSYGKSCKLGLSFKNSCSKHSKVPEKERFHLRNSHQISLLILSKFKWNN